LQCSFKIVIFDHFQVLADFWSNGKTICAVQYYIGTMITDRKVKVSKKIKNDQSVGLHGSIISKKTRARICKRLRSPAYVLAWRADTTNRVVVPAGQAGNRFLDPLKGLQIRAQTFCCLWYWLLPHTTPLTNTGNAQRLYLS
jgi:hypothetical protein